jgi:C4-dicarboxylate-binding protein DctP
MKKRFSLMLVLLIMVGAVLSACGGANNAEGGNADGETAADGGKPILIKFSHVVDENSPKGKAANMFRDLVKERLGDKVEVQVFPNSQLYDDASGVEALEAGNIQMMAPSTSQLFGLDKSLQIFMMPFLFKNGEQAVEFSKSEQGQKLFSNLDKYNIKVLDTWLGGDMHLSNNVRPIEKPEDLKGIKFRVMSGGIMSDKFELLGASATVIPFSETYVALQQGTVDGQENPYNNIETQKIYEVQKYITETSHTPATYSLIVNADFWNGLPEDIRTELEKIIQEVTAQEVKWNNELNEKSKQIIEESGKTQITTLTDEQRKAFADAMKPLYDKYADEIGQEYIDYAKSLGQ